MRTQQIRDLIDRNDWQTLRDSWSSDQAPEIAECLRDLEKPKRVLLFRALSREVAAEVFAHMAPEAQDGLLGELADDETRELLANLRPDDRTRLLEELPGQVTSHLLRLLSPEDLQEARSLLGYPEESVGRLMTPHYVAILRDWTIARALEQIRAEGQDSETINRVYVVDASGCLIDDIELRKIILADPQSGVDQVMDHSFVSVSAFADREEAVALIRRYDFVALPVVDSDGVLIGIVTVDDVLDVAVAEATEDFHKAGSVGPILISLREARVAFLFRRRIGWLLTLVFVNIFSGATLAYYQDVIADSMALIFFLPLLIASAGNAGAQSATLMVRAMATGDVRMRDWFVVAGKELAVATALGTAMAVAVSVLGVYRGGADIGAIVALTMVAVVIVGSLIGMSLPFALTHLELDPAAASAPLVTSIADITGVFIYFSIASWYLGG